MKPYRNLTQGSTSINKSTLASANSQRIGSGLIMTSRNCTLSSQRKLKHQE